ncbi:hypothetical protein GC097_23745 [Paenibacillus sp. LMG 31457]|uniref:Threonine/Serine exporter ThrE domain-containing protein n=2 Tax=Paenibacillus planticolens TaxID=2654976 RepID=A0ABX1ZTC0_9BACL|nr:hypothetical protein [Paenibacillus planticolens]
MLEQLITSFTATAAFAILFNVPRNTIVQCGFVGMVGWMLYASSLLIPLNPILATLIASFFVTVMSQFFARLYKTPVIVFSIAGIIPLVPGGLAYDAMKNVVLNHYDLAVQLAAKAFMLSGAIAMGLVFSEVLNQLFRRTKP